MAEAHGSPSDTVTASDVERVVRLAVAALGEAEERDWGTRAGALRWDCWETVEHLADSLVYYAAQLGPRKPPLSGPVPFAWSDRRPGGPVNIVFVNRDAGPAGLFQGLEACSGVLAAMLRTSPSTARAYHIFGQSDPEGFAAMAVVETLVHTYDAAEGLGVGWIPPGDLCARVLARLFPHVPADAAAPWPTLLWATGRAALDDRPRLGDWRWYSAPRGEGGPAAG
jgi:hypothetical protein